MGRERHLLVDTLGLMIAVCVMTACVQDRDGLKKLCESRVEMYVENSMFSL
jgi:hypothetical protein